MKKKLVVICFSILLLGVVGGFLYYKTNEKFTYEWVEVDDSSVGQYRLYINDSFGRHVNGTARLVYINGKSKRVEVDKDGLLYVKSLVTEVRNPKGK